MRRYESIFITSPTLSQEERQPLFDKVTKIISDGQGLLVKVDDWGVRSLAYEVKKQTRGYYVLTDFCGDGSLVKELERNMSLDERFLKFMTVCTAEEVDEDAIQSEIEAARERASRPDAVPEAAPSGAAEEDRIETSEPMAHETEVAEDTSGSSDEEGPVNGEV
jgi:small subunit ribosomal protein S6